MRAQEFITEEATAGTTSAGSVATVALPLGAVISRSLTPKNTKYSNTWVDPKKRKKHASG